MNKKNAILAFGLLVATGMASVAVAADTGFYVMGGFGQQFNSETKSDGDAVLTGAGVRGFSSSISKPTAYRLQLGYQVNTNFAIEGGYGDAGDEKYSASGGNLNGTIITGKLGLKVLNVNAVGILPVADKFSLLGKLGYANVKASATLASVNVDATKDDFTYGIGAKYDITKEVFTRLDVDSYKVGTSSTSSRVNFWMFNIGYKF